VMGKSLVVYAEKPARTEDVTGAGVEADDRRMDEERAAVAG
jgi:hypothetical protein